MKFFSSLKHHISKRKVFDFSITTAFTVICFYQISELALRFSLLNVAQLFTIVKSCLKPINQSTVIGESFPLLGSFTKKIL